MKQKQYVVAFVTLRAVLARSPQYEGALKLQSKLAKKMEILLEDETKESHRYWVYQGVLDAMAGRTMSAVESWKKSLAIRPNDQIIELAIEEIRGDMKTAPGIVSVLDDQQPCDCDVSSSSARVELKPTSPIPAIEVKMPEPPIPLPPQVSVSAESLTATKLESGKIQVTVIPESTSEITPSASTEFNGDVIRKAQVLMQLNRFNEAIHLLEKELARNEDQPEVREALQSAVAKKVQAGHQFYRTGLLEYARGNYSEAIDHWKRALQVDPDHPHAKKVLLRAFFKRR